jgi:hypothetical protein
VSGFWKKRNASTGSPADAADGTIKVQEDWLAALLESTVNACRRDKVDELRIYYEVPRGVAIIGGAEHDWVVPPAYAATAFALYVTGLCSPEWQTGAPLPTRVVGKLETPLGEGMVQLDVEQIVPPPEGCLIMRGFNRRC